MEENKNYQEHCEEYYKEVARKRDVIRRREMFERVALILIPHSGWTYEQIAYTAEQILERADKFAKEE